MSGGQTFQRPAQPRRRRGASDRRTASRRDRRRGAVEAAEGARRPAGSGDPDRGGAGGRARSQPAAARRVGECRGRGPIAKLADQRRYAALPLAQDLLPVLDNVDRAIAAAEKNHDAGVAARRLSSWCGSSSSASWRSTTSRKSPRPGSRVRPAVPRGDLAAALARRARRITSRWSTQAGLPAARSRRAAGAGDRLQRPGSVSQILAPQTRVAATTVDFEP